MSRETSYDRSATRAVIRKAALCPRGQYVVTSWLSAWQADRLPSPNEFLPRLHRFRRLILDCAIQIGGGAEIISAGEDITRIAGTSLVGTDWYSWIPQRDVAEFIQRMESVADGALLRTVRHISSSQETTYAFEVISLPTRPDKNGLVHVLTFFDWRPPGKMTAPSSFRELMKPPIFGHFIPIVRARRDCLLEASPKVFTAEQRAKITSHAAVRMVLNFMCMAMKQCAAADLDSTDYLIAITVDAKNVAHIADDPIISLRYAQAIEPIWMRRGVSRAEVSRITHIAPETVRRRINRLIKRGVFEERSDGIVISATPNEIAPHPGRYRANAKLVENLVEELRIRGISY